jgi:hypothetical protein
MEGADRERLRELCDLASVEQDPKKLNALMKEINDLLDAKQRRLHEAANEARSQTG